MSFRNLYTFKRLLPMIYLVFIFSTGCGDLSWNPPNPGSIMAELESPDKNIYARVIATEVQGTYKFEVLNMQSEDVLVEKEISAPIGYHSHVVTLAWSEDGQTVSATINHDFGEGNKVFQISVVNLNA